MWTGAILIIVLGLTMNYFLFMRDWLHWQKRTVFSVKPGPCQNVKPDGGSEDIVYIGDGLFLISSVNNLGPMDGEVLGLDVNGSPKVITINITDVPTSEKPILSLPTGMSIWNDSDTGKVFLYVITHPLSEDKVRVFEVLKPLQLKYVKTITDPKFTLMNNLVMVGLDQFYITKYTMFRSMLGLKLEHWSHLKKGKIFYYDGRRAREVSSGYFLPNGINVSPDKTMIYMAEWGGQKLHGFKRDSTNGLNKVWDIDLGTGMDNIDVDDEGNLWIGCHPITWMVIDYLNIFGSTLPSQVVKVRIRDHVVDDIELIYMDDGEQCTGSTVANYRNGKLIIGTFQKQTIMCDVNYLND